MAITPAPVSGRVAPAETALPDSLRKTSSGLAPRSLDWVRRDAHDDPQAVPFGAGTVVQHGLHKLALLRAASRKRLQGGGDLAPGF